MRLIYSAERKNARYDASPLHMIYVGAVDVLQLQLSIS